MKKLTIIFALFFIALTANTNFGQDLKSNQSNDKEKLIKVARLLEETPLGEEAQKMRRWAFTYIAETKDVSVVICGGELNKAALDKKNKNGGDLLIQYAIGMAAFKLENPDQTDENAAQLAGMESMLKAYEAIINADAKSKFAGMDALIAKRDKGELKALVEAANCGKK